MCIRDRPKGGSRGPRETQRRAKGRPREAQGGPKEPKRARSGSLFGTQVTKKRKNPKRGFSKTELSFENGAHFERGRAKGRPRGAQGVHREPKGGPSKAQGRLKGAKGTPKGAKRGPRNPLGLSKDTKGAPREAQGRPKERPREAKGRPKEAKGGQARPETKTDPNQARGTCFLVPFLDRF